MTRTRVATVTLSTAALLMLAASSGWANDGRNLVRFQATLQTTTRIVQPPPGRCDDRPNLPPVVGLLEAVGAGDANLLGPVFDEQSHCVRADGTFFGGQFTLTNAKGKKLSGRYFGRLIPTFNSKVPPPPPPLGPWLIQGYVCIGKADDNCYQSARGITDLSTGVATIFLDQWIEPWHVK